jgi:hypothetical protein
MAKPAITDAEMMAAVEAEAGTARAVMGFVHGIPSSAMRSMPARRIWRAGSLARDLRSSAASAA